jgi:hypothetical protein
MCLGDVNGNGEIDIGDALELLKYLAGLDSVIPREIITWEDERTWNAARVRNMPEPEIEDALEILKHLAGLPSQIPS